MGPQGVVFTSFNHTSWLIHGQQGANRSARSLWICWIHLRYCSKTSSVRGLCVTSCDLISIFTSYREALNLVRCPHFTVCRWEDLLVQSIIPQDGLWSHFCGWNITSSRGYTSSWGRSENPCTVPYASWQCATQYGDLDLTIFDLNHTAISWNCNYWILKTVPWCPGDVPNIHKCSLWFRIIIGTEKTVSHVPPL